MTPQTQNMVEVAQAYCDLIETAAEHDPVPRWLDEVASLLPRLSLAVASLETDSRAGTWIVPDIEARFDLFARLHELLGELDAYWLEFDAMADESCKSGSLADDLTDIYCELKNGLKMLGVAGDGDASANPQLAVVSWREGYRRHWARHLFDAQRHLNDLDLPR